MKNKKIENDFLQEQIKKGDYTFLLDYYDKLDNLEDFFTEISSKEQAELNFGEISALYNYYHELDEDLDSLENIKKFLEYKLLRNILLTLLLSGPFFLIDKFILFFILCLIMGALGLKLNKPLNKIKYLLKNFQNYNDNILTYSGVIAEYDTLKRAKESYFKNIYLDLVTMISKNDLKKRQQLYEQLKILCSTYKNNPWKLLSKLRAMQSRIKEEVVNSSPNINFIIAKLTNYLGTLEEIDQEIIAEISYYIATLPEESRKDSYLKLAATIIDLIIEITSKKHAENPGYSLKRLIAEELSQINPNLSKYLIEVINAWLEIEVRPTPNEKPETILIQGITSLINKRRPLKRELATI